MARFWIIQDDRGETVGCEMTWRAATKFAEEMGVGRSRICWVECAVNADTIRRLLGNLGGYATRVEDWYDDALGKPKHLGDDYDEQ